MRKYLVILAALGAASACSAAAQGGDHAGYGPAAEPREIACVIEARPTDHGYVFEARALGPYGLSADYDLTLNKSGPSGSSDIAQSGAFAFETGRFTSLGEAELSVAEGDRVEARLDVRGANGGYCHAARRI